MALRTYNTYLLVTEDEKVHQSLKQHTEEKSAILIHAQDLQDAKFKIKNQKFQLVIIEIDKPFPEIENFVKDIKLTSPFLPIWLISNLWNYCVPLKELYHEFYFLESPYPKGHFLELFDLLTDKTNLKEKEMEKKLDLKNINILIVDDIADNRKILELFLKDLGAITDEACNGKEACDLIKFNNYDLVLLDYTMPEMNGEEVLTFIRKNHSMSDLPVYIISGQDDINKIHPLLKLGLNDYIVRPFDFQTLTQKIHGLFAKKSVDANKVNCITKTFIETKYLKDTVEFYRKILGMNESKIIMRGRSKIKKFAIFELGPKSQIIITCGIGPGTSNKELSIKSKISFYMDNLRNFSKHLKDLHVDFKKIKIEDSMDETPCIEVTDPNGNSIYFYEK